MLKHEQCCVLPTWWLSRGGCTRSHSEHGRETPQRQWYSVSRRGRVGRCQVCKTQQISSHSQKGLQALIKRPLKRPLCYNNPAHNVPKQIGHPITVRPLKETNRL